ncbi:MAG TPA: hypothetical protein VIX91_23795 [Candidatus Acidoferrum sp.]
MFDELFRDPRVAAAYADEAWQRQKIHEYFRQKLKTGGVSYQDLKDFVTVNGWQKTWLDGGRLRGC